MINRTKEINEYKKANYKRVSLELKKDFYNEIQEHIEETGESLNGFIKRAIKEQLKRDKKN